MRRVAPTGLATLAAFACYAEGSSADTALTGPCLPANTAIVWATPAANESWDGQASGLEISDDGTVWTLARCEITLDPVAWAALDRGAKCSLMLHEFGHLYFARHTASGLMAPTDDRWVPGCHTLRERVQHDLLSGLPTGAGVICGRGRSVFFCRTFTTGADGWQVERRYRVRVKGTTYTTRRVAA